MTNRPGFCDGCHGCVEPCDKSTIKQLQADKLKWIDEVYYWKQKWSEEYWTARDYEYDKSKWLEKYK